jgi:hypothetical protein
MKGGRIEKKLTFLLRVEWMTRNNGMEGFGEL